MDETVGEQQRLPAKHPSQRPLKSKHAQNEALLLELAQLQVEQLCDAAQDALSSQPPIRAVAREALRKARHIAQALPADSPALGEVARLEALFLPPPTAAAVQSASVVAGPALIDRATEGAELPAELAQQAIQAAAKDSLLAPASEEISKVVVPTVATKAVAQAEAKSLGKVDRQRKLPPETAAPAPAVQADGAAPATNPVALSPALPPVPERPSKSNVGTTLATSATAPAQPAPREPGAAQLRLIQVLLPLRRWLAFGALASVLSLAAFWLLGWEKQRQTLARAEALATQGDVAGVGQLQQRNPGLHAALAAALARAKQVEENLRLEERARRVGELAVKISTLADGEGFRELLRQDALVPADHPMLRSNLNTAVQAARARITDDLRRQVETSATKAQTPADVDALKQLVATNQFLLTGQTNLVVALNQLVAQTEPRVRDNLALAQLTQAVGTVLTNQNLAAGLTRAKELIAQEGALLQRRPVEVQALRAQVGEAEVRYQASLPALVRLTGLTPLSRAHAAGATNRVDFPAVATNGLTVTNLLQGVWQLQVTHPLYGESRKETLTLTNPAPVTVPADRWTYELGALQVTGTNPPAGLPVPLTRPVVVTVAGTGTPSLLFTRLTPTAQAVRVAAEGYQPLTRTVAVSAGQTTNWPLPWLALQPMYGSLTVALAGPPGARVLVRQGTNEVPVPVQDGQWRLTSLLAGDYELVARHRALMPQALWVAVPPGEAVRTNLTLPYAVLVVAGVQPSNAVVTARQGAVSQRLELGTNVLGPGPWQLAGEQPGRSLSQTVALTNTEHRTLRLALRSAVELATKDAPYINSLGMKFVPVAGTDVLFSIWHTRVQDYQAFATATGRKLENPGFTQGPTHPVCMVSWEDAQAFAKWLTEKERKEGRLTAGQSYRLPQDWEWSMAVGLNEALAGTPKDKDGKIKDVYPWGNQWPPPYGAGNYATYLKVDGYDNTSPVGSFNANKFGLFDLGGNVWQWCGDFYDEQSGSHVLRGGAWNRSTPSDLLSSYRYDVQPGNRYVSSGFRLVVVGELAAPGAGAPPNSTPKASAKKDSQPQPKEPSGPVVGLPTASKESPYINSLGMKFVPVAGTDVLFSIWHTRVQDYQAFATATGRKLENPGFTQGPTHPVCMVSWEDAQAFAKWLTEKERKEGKLTMAQSYRLPQDWEWSVAVGLNEPRAGTPKDKDKKIKDVFPWGSQWPPPAGAGNYAGEGDGLLIAGFRDGFVRTSPAGSFNANKFGLFDMGGNLWQWCEDRYDGEEKLHGLRGGSWGGSKADSLWSSSRDARLPGAHYVYNGFRMVLAGGGGAGDKPRSSSGASLNVAVHRDGTITITGGGLALDPSSATKANPWANSLGMKFVPVAGTDVLFCLWHTRVQDFEAFVKDTGHNATVGMHSFGSDGWKQRGDSWKSPGFPQTGQHPVCGVSWEDAQAFAKWLTQKERGEGKLTDSQSYRLPQDWEWSVAVGLNEARAGTPKDKDGKIKDVYPWGNQWPPPNGAGNYAGEGDGINPFIAGFKDGFPRTSPVGSFNANKFGLYDLGGNLWQWCEDWYDGEQKDGVMRGGAWNFSSPAYLLSSCRGNVRLAVRNGYFGFRLVVVVGARP